MLTLRQKISKNYINSLGWKNKRKLVIIESDDWGAVRMPDRSAYEYFLSKNISVDQNYFDKYDSLETSDDLELLFDVLSSFKDINGNMAVITAYAVVANPDFQKIINNNKKEYCFEEISSSYQDKKKSANSLNLIHEGIKTRIFYPQFHGREHINVTRWMLAINSGSQKEELAFRKRALISSDLKGDTYSFPLNIFSAFDKTFPEDERMHNEIITEGLSLFKEIFGFNSISFMAPTGIWYDSINPVLHQNGVLLQHGRQAQIKNNKKFKFIHYPWGSKNHHGQIHWRRNCTFEPARNQNYDWVNRCLKEIEIAFRWGKPAVINSHRVNYIGSIFPENRDQSLRKLKILLTEVQKRWPDVEFFDTERLAHLMLKSLNMEEN